MKINIIFYVACLLFCGSALYAQSCGCTSMNNYGVEFPSTGNTPVSNATHLLNLSSAVLTSGNNLHFYFPNKPCNNTVGNPCYGTYQATINGHVVNSVGGNTINQHIQIPASFLVVGANTITVKATCGSTDCSLPTTVVNVIAPSSAVASITLASECCSVISGPQHTSTYTGQVRFKMGGTASVGVKLKIITSAGISFQNFQAATGSGDGYTGCYSGTVTFIVLDALNNPITSATINGQPYNVPNGYHLKYTKPIAACMQQAPPPPHIEPHL